MATGQTMKTRGVRVELKPEDWLRLECEAMKRGMRGGEMAGRILRRIVNSATALDQVLSAEPAAGEGA